MKPRRKIARYSFQERPREHCLQLTTALAFASLAVVVALSAVVIRKNLLPQPIVLACFVVAGACFVVCEDRLVRGGLLRRPRHRWRVFAAGRFAIALFSAQRLAVLLLVLYSYFRWQRGFVGAVPLPALTIAMAAFSSVVLIGSAWAAWHAQKRARQLRRRCASCGYNLRRSSTGVCPECGRVASATRSSASAA